MDLNIFQISQASPKNLNHYILDCEVNSNILNSRKTSQTNAFLCKANNSPENTTSYYFVISATMLTENTAGTVNCFFSH